MMRVQKLSAVDVIILAYFEKFNLVISLGHVYTAKIMIMNEVNMTVCLVKHYIYCVLLGESV